MAKWIKQLSVLVLLLWSASASAQCSMCKAVAETADGGAFAAGLNNGILYLMAFPYIIVAVIAYRLVKLKREK